MSTVANIGAGSTATSADPANLTTNGPKTLGQDDFLKLLVTQMTSQDPLNPQSDTNFVAQMAQFTSLDQTKAMGANLSMIQANGLIGQTVTVKTGEGDPVIGLVNGVQMTDGAPQLLVNSQLYDLSAVQAVMPTNQLAY